MSTQDPSRTPPGLTSLPRLEDLQRSADGYDVDRVAEAFESFRRHTAQLQAQLRVLQAASRGGTQQVEATGHAVRMDALHLIRAASEYADTVERDAQKASETQLHKAEEEVRRRRRELQERETEVERYRQESERQRAELLNNARNEVRELLANANRDATQELREAEARGSRMLEQARHQAMELTNSARAEVEQTLEWARAQAAAILQRAQTGAEQLLAAAGLGEDEIGRVAESIVTAAENATDASRAPAAPSRPSAAMAAPPPPAEAEGGVQPTDAAAAPQVEDTPPTPAGGVAEPPVSPPTVTEGAAETGTGEGDSPDEHAP
jgi:cell division septum initiation protein DivIVA